MRLHQRGLRTVYVRHWTTIKDNEGCKYSDYGTAYAVNASIQPLGGQVSATEPGLQLQYMLQMRVNTLDGIKEKDGICVYVGPTEKPDYEVISIKFWDVSVLELKKRGAT